MARKRKKTNQQMPPEKSKKQMHSPDTATPIDYKRSSVALPASGVEAEKTVSVPKKKRRYVLSKPALSEIEDDGNASVYESDEERFREDKFIAQGAYSSVRLFSSCIPNEPLKKPVQHYFFDKTTACSSSSNSNHPMPVSDKHDFQRVVLKPRDPEKPHLNEAHRKASFFRRLYSVPVSLFYTRTTYRLIIPAIPGQTYFAVKAMNPDLRHKIELFLSTVEALEDCHKKKIIIIDLKLDNILYHALRKKSYLIDGGICSLKDNPLLKGVFEKKDRLEIITNQRLYYHIAPECYWLEGDTPIKATEAMDIYSFGQMMISFFQNENPTMQVLISQCISDDPLKRPTLKAIKHTLESELALLESPPVLTYSDHLTAKR